MGSDEELEAYETLKDVNKRRQYDSELDSA